MRTSVLVIGAGHAGLAMSRCLTEHAIDHVVLERGEVANSWRTERWDALRLLTPNWQSRLPGFVEPAGDPHGYRTMPQTIAFIERYARHIQAPVRTGTRVTSVRRAADGYQVGTDDGLWRARAVVLATGACNLPAVPVLAEPLPAGVSALTPMQYRNPAQLADGGVLVVGASASGVQIADEIRRSGRAVLLAVGEHIRMPRRYRGRDIQWWMDAVGVLDQRYEEVDDIERARNVPSLQLAGTPDGRDVDLNALVERGVRLVGRLVGIRDGRAQFSGSLANHAALSDLKMNRLLERIDAWVAGSGREAAFEPAQRFEPTRVESSPLLSLDLRSGAIRTVIWATGYRPDYSWLHIPVFDRKGRLRHDGGVVLGAPGLYAMGLPFMRRRKSALIDGAGADAVELGEHLALWLAKRPGGSHRPALAQAGSALSCMAAS